MSAAVQLPLQRRSCTTTFTKVGHANSRVEGTRTCSQAVWQESPFSPVQEVAFSGASPPGCGHLRLARIAPPGAAAAPGRHAAPLPTILAVSGERQQHVSRFVRAWRAEKRGWQVLIPMRREDSSPKLFESDGVDIVVSFMEFVLGHSQAWMGVLPAPIEGGRLHLVGTSNGGATVLAAACQVPELVASLTLVTGFVPTPVKDISALSAVPLIRLYAGVHDELGHQEVLKELKQGLDCVGVAATLRLLPGAGHVTAGQHVDMGQFWRELEAARPKADRLACESPARLSPAAGKDKFAIGSRVEVLYDGAWLAGTVAQLPRDDLQRRWRWAIQRDCDKQGTFLYCYAEHMRLLPGSPNRGALAQACAQTSPGAAALQRDEEASPVVAAVVAGQGCQGSSPLAAAASSPPSPASAEKKGSPPRPSSRGAPAESAASPAAATCPAGGSLRTMLRASSLGPAAETAQPAAAAASPAAATWPAGGSVRTVLRASSVGPATKSAQPPAAAAAVAAAPARQLADDALRQQLRAATQVLDRRAPRSSSVPPPQQPPDPTIDQCLHAARQGRDSVREQLDAARSQLDILREQLATSRRSMHAPPLQPRAARTLGLAGDSSVPTAALAASPRLAQAPQCADALSRQAQRCSSVTQRQPSPRDADAQASAGEGQASVPGSCHALQSGLTDRHLSCRDAESPAPAAAEGPQLPPSGSSHTSLGSLTDGGPSSVSSAVSQPAPQHAPDTQLASGGPASPKVVFRLVRCEDGVDGSGGAVFLRPSLDPESWCQEARTPAGARAGAGSISLPASEEVSVLSTASATIGGRLDDFAQVRSRSGAVGWIRCRSLESVETNQLQWEIDACWRVAAPNGRSVTLLAFTPEERWDVRVCHGEKVVVVDAPAGELCRVCTAKNASGWIKKAFLGKSELVMAVRCLEAANRLDAVALRSSISPEETSRAKLLHGEPVRVSASRMALSGGLLRGFAFVTARSGHASGWVPLENLQAFADLAPHNVASRDNAGAVRHDSAKFSSSFLQHAALACVRR